MIPSDKMILYLPEPKMLTNIKASKMLGNEASASLNLINISSASPPKNPVNAPTIMPAASPIKTVETATINVTRRPSQTRLKISLP